MVQTHHLLFCISPHRGCASPSSPSFFLSSSSNFSTQADARRCKDWPLVLFHFWETHFSRNKSQICLFGINQKQSFKNCILALFFVENPLSTELFRIIVRAQPYYSRSYMTHFVYFEFQEPDYLYSRSSLNGFMSIWADMRKVKKLPRATFLTKIFPHKMPFLKCTKAQISYLEYKIWAKY